MQNTGIPYIMVLWKNDIKMYKPFGAFSYAIKQE